MTHYRSSIIQCNHIGAEGQCPNRHSVATAHCESYAEAARYARRTMATQSPEWQIGVTGHLNGMALDSLDFCPEHHVTTEEPYPGAKPHYDLMKIPNLKKD